MKLSHFEEIDNSNEKWITYDNNLWKRSWFKKDEAAQTVAKHGLMPCKIMIYWVRLEGNRVSTGLTWPDDS